VGQLLERIINFLKALRVSGSKSYPQSILMFRQLFKSDRDNCIAFV